LRDARHRALISYVPRILTFVEPQLATLADVVPTGDQWAYEIKLDGYRTVTSVDGKSVACYSRNGLDWTPRFGQLPAALAALKLKGALLDGEVVAFDANGHVSFSALQRALTAGGEGLSYFVFDLLFEAGKDLRPLPLLERKLRLKKLLRPAGMKGPIYYSEHVIGDGRKMFDALCEAEQEGMIAKRTDRPYRSGRGLDWLKLKCGNEQEFIVIGYTVSDRHRPFSSLMLAVREGGELRHVGRVGTGFDDRELERLARMMEPLRTEKAPVREVKPGQVRRKIRWILPRLIVQVRFTGWTHDGVLRHPSYQGLREDKTAREVVRERARKVAG
jgi:bifunctional non-homologous end joining protein LigD